MFVGFYNKLIFRIRKINFFHKYPVAKELIKYSLVGNFSNLIDLSLYVYLTRAFSFWHEHYLIANIFTMLIASILRFVFHKRWTFRDSGKNIRRQYFRFIIVLLLALLINEIILYYSVEVFYLNDLIGKLTALAIGTLIVYYLTKMWVFVRQDDSVSPFNHLK